jgi:hypothetical protein
MRHALIHLAALLAGIAPALAQHAHHAPAAHPPAGSYAGLQAREVAGLSAEEVADLRAGRGMGMALPAELNGYPGPMHALDLAGPLGLSEAQRATLTAEMSAMRQAARPLADQLIAAEQALDALFRQVKATPEDVASASEAAALARGRLRALHLQAHLVTRAALTPEQRQTYARLRGYDPAR